MNPAILRLFVATALIAGLAAPAAAQTPAAPTKTAPAPAPAPSQSTEHIKTSEDLKRESVSGAVTTPLRDLNVSRPDIPEILRQALTDPYARPPRNWKCPTLETMVRPLDEVLGPDIDREPPGDENLMNRHMALGAAADIATSVIIPFRGVVRKISGAESYDKLMQSAIIAGDVRRAYLKGLGEAKGCSPPATPSHERAGTPPISVERKMPSPKYPIRPESAESQASAGTPPNVPR